MEEMAYQAQQRQLDELKYLDELDQAAGGEHRNLVAAARSQQMANPVPRDTSRPQTREVKAVFEAVPNGLNFYNVYRRLSDSTHAGLGSAIPFLAPAQRSGGPLTAEPELDYWAEYAALLSWSCWAADDAMLRFLEDGADLADRQVELLARIGIAPG